MNKIQIKMKLSEVIKINEEADSPEEFLNITRDRSEEIFCEVDSIKNEAGSYKNLILKSMSLYDKIEENLLALMYACFIFGKDVEKSKRMKRWIQEQAKALDKQSIEDIFLNLREQ